jgi:hypothetical protein
VIRILRVDDRRSHQPNCRADPGADESAIRHPHGAPLIDPFRR